MKNAKFPADVNSSYTIFFFIAVLIFSYIFSTSFGDLRYASLVSISLFALLMYFTWDFIKQLYNPGQAVFLYALIYIILPLSLGLLTHYPVASLGAIVYIAASVTAGATELIYEFILKKRLPESYFKRLLLADNRIDKSFIKLSHQHVYLSSYKGLAFACLLAVLYLGLSYFLFV